MDFLKDKCMKFKYLGLATFHIILVIAFMIIFDYKQEGDSPRYLAVANEFASLKFHFSPELNCNTAPGYPIFLALIKIFTQNNMFLIAVFQSIFFIVSFWYFLNSIRFKYGICNTNALLLSVFVLLNPEIIHLNGPTMTESLAATLILFICGSLVNDLRKKNDKFIFVISFSFLVLTKMEYLLLLPVVIPFLYFMKQHKIIIVTLVALVGLLTLNGIKNQSTFGVFKMTSFGAGTVIYGGNNLNLDGSWHISEKTKNYIPEIYLNAFDSINKLSASCACVKKDSLYKKMAIDAWKKSYTDQLKVIPLKFGKLWLLPGNMDFYTGQSEIHRGLQLEKLFSDELWPWYGKWKHGAYLIIYYFSLLLSLIGLWFKIKKYNFDKIDILIISILLVNTLMYSTLFYGLGKFRLPVISILFYYAVYFFLQCFKKQECQLPTATKKW